MAGLLAYMTIKVPRRQFDENGNPIWVEPPETKEERCAHQRVITKLQNELTARYDCSAYQYTAKHREWVANYSLPKFQRELAELEAGE